MKHFDARNPIRQKWPVPEFANQGFKMNVTGNGENFIVALGHRKNQHRLVCYRICTEKKDESLEVVYRHEFHKRKIDCVVCIGNRVILLTRKVNRYFTETIRLDQKPRHKIRIRPIPVVLDDEPLCTATDPELAHVAFADQTLALLYRCKSRLDDYWCYSMILVDVDQL